MSKLIFKHRQYFIDCLTQNFGFFYNILHSKVLLQDKLIWTSLLDLINAVGLDVSLLQHYYCVYNVLYM